MPDERVQAAISNWAPRFVSQGVDMNDFQRVTAPVETWPEWLPAWVENGDRHAQLAREAEARGRTLTAGQAWNHAALSYHFAKFVWMVDMDLYRDAADAFTVQAVADNQPRARRRRRRRDAEGRTPRSSYDQLQRFDKKELIKRIRSLETDLDAERRRRGALAYDQQALLAKMIRLESEIVLLKAA